MEEAYSDLYQQFLRLRSLCMRQAAMLQQLSAALQKQQGATVSNGDLGDMMSIPVQCTHEIPLAAIAHNSAAQCGADCLPRNVGTFSDLLAEDMSKLCVNVPRQRKEDGMLEQKVTPLVSMDSSRWQGASSNVSKRLWQADHPGGDRTTRTVMMPAIDSPSLGGNLLSQSDGMLMSDMALQSHTCEFCQAVFPGDTSTRGAFLRHLYTHIT